MAKAQRRHDAGLVLLFTDLGMWLEHHCSRHVEPNVVVCLVSFHIVQGSGLVWHDYHLRCSEVLSNLPHLLYVRMLEVEERF